MKYSSAYTATVDIDRDTEFTNDDADQYSSLVCLDKPYRKLLISLPTVTSSPMNIYVQDGDSIATVPKPFHHGQVVGATPAWATAIWVTTASAGDCVFSVDMGFVQFFRLRFTTNQTTTDKEITVRGMS